MAQAAGLGVAPETAKARAGVVASYLQPADVPAEDP